jgi:hypothetical protein
MPDPAIDSGTHAPSSSSALPSPLGPTGQPVSGSNQQPRVAADASQWDRKPTLIPVTVDLGKHKQYNPVSMTDHISVGLDPTSEAHIMHPLNTNKMVYEQFTKTQAEKLARATQGNAEHIYKQLDEINVLFKDGDRRSSDPRIFVFNCVVPIMGSDTISGGNEAGTAGETDNHHNHHTGNEGHAGIENVKGDGAETGTHFQQGYFLAHRFLWDLNTPVGMMDVYCQEVCSDIGLGVGVARALREKVESEVNVLRKALRSSGSAGTGPKKVPEGYIEFESKTGEAIVRDCSRIKFPVVIKGSAREAMELEARMRRIGMGDGADGEIEALFDGSAMES